MIAFGKEITWGTSVMPEWHGLLAGTRILPVKVRKDVLVRDAVTSPRRLKLKFEKVGKPLR